MSGYHRGRLLIAALLLLPACTPAYVPVDPAHPPAQSAFSVATECFRASGIDGVGVGAMGGAVGGLATAVAWNQAGGPQSVNACMRQQGWLATR